LKRKQGPAPTGIRILKFQSVETAAVHRSWAISGLSLLCAPANIIPKIGLLEIHTIFDSGVQQAETMHGLCLRMYVVLILDY
jgi:hypothetical protein